MGILTKIRQKSDRQKNFISLIGSAVLTLIIFLSWFSFSADSTKESIINKTENKLSEISPLQIIKEDISNAFSEFNSKISDLKNISSSTDLVETINIDDTDFLSTSTATVTPMTDIIIEEIN
jgi:hypothetical protein